MTIPRLTLCVLLTGALALGASCNKTDKADSEAGGAKQPTPSMKAPERATPTRPAPMDPKAMAADPKATPTLAADPMAARPAAAPPAALKVPTQHGPVYFGTKDRGLVLLTDGKFHQGSPNKKWIKVVARAPNGTIYLAAIGGIYHLDKKRARKIGGYRDVGGPEAMAVDAKGGLWTVSFKGVGYYDGKKWTLEGKDKLGKVSLLKGVAVDARGRVVVASSNGLHLRENNAWRSLNVSAVLPGRIFFKRVALSPTGAIFIAGSKGLLKYHNGQLSVVPISSRYLHDMAVGNDGRIYLRDRSKVYVLDAAGKELRSFTMKALGVKARRVDRMAGDASGRLWLTTDHGVVIVDKAGKAVQWEPGVFREIAGQITLIHPVAAGPAALPVAGKKLTGNVRGRVVRGTVAVANAPIEICESPASYSRGSPCAKAIWKKVGVTDAKGGFLFKGVPVGTYGFAVKGGPKWSVLSKYFSRCCTKIQAGKTLNIGKLKLKLPKSK